MSRRLPSSWLLAIAAGGAAAALAGCGSAHGPGSAAGTRSSAAASATATAGGTGAGSAVTTCPASGLRVRLDTAAGGVALGSYYVPLEFTNTSARTCRLTGYPAVAFASGVSGQPIGTHAAVDRAVRVRPVLLAPGGTAHAWLQVLSTANYPKGKCHPVTAAGLRVAAPGSVSASYVQHPVTVCQRVVKGSDILTVHPVQQGRARRGTA